MLFATGHSLAAVTAGRFLIGASAAFSLVGAMAVAGQWFPANRFAVLSGGAMAMGMAGGVFGQAPLRLAVEASDWRTANLLLAAGGVALAVAAWATVRDKWRGAGGVADVLAGLGVVVRHRQTWLIALSGLGTSAPLLGFASLWGVPFLETAYALPRTHAATLTSMLFVGWGVGAPLFGWLSDRIGRRKAPLLAGLALETLALAILIYRSRAIRACGGWLVLPGRLSGIVADRVLCAGQGEPPPRAQRHGDRLRQRHGDGGGRPVPASRRLPARPCLDGRDARLGARVYQTGAYRLALASLIACGLAGLLCLLAGARDVLPRRRPETARSEPGPVPGTKSQRYQGTFTLPTRCSGRAVGHASQWAKTFRGEARAT